ncbi:hypothetical protein DEO72_LG7g1253 [Vigna unguiculata]|uniref:Uncharacterized protein n=1 Tax=Vigna unguiculata TaxID=3917 RepID=A0A4D6MJ08_VIGUN|nr:hypothetical protein DEO72_LG7g1253 [Vigna unguiculata]
MAAAPRCDAGADARWLTVLLREGRDATAVAGEDGSCANGGRWWRCHGVDGASWWPEEVLRWCVKVAAMAKARWWSENKLHGG